MPRIDTDAAREYEDGSFAANGVFKTDDAKMVYACFEPGQFIPVHAPDSDVVVTVRRGLRNDEFEPTLGGAAAETDSTDAEVRH